MNPLKINSIISLNSHRKNIRTQIYLIYLLIITLSTTISTIINLSYAKSQDGIKRYPIQLSFNQTQTFTPSGLQSLILPQGYKIEMNTKTHNESQTPQNQQKVIIGLKNPSQFLIAASKTFNVQLDQIQISTQDYNQLILKDINFIESREVFKNNALYDYRVIYNYGQSINIPQRPCQLIDGDQIYFNEILLRQILNEMSSQNKILFQFNQTQNTVQLSGDLDNFPKITLIRNTYLFQLKFLKKDQLKYIPSKAEVNIISQNDTKGMKTVSIKQNQESDQTTKIGIRTLAAFGKFQVEDDNIVFKRTSLLYLLYLFFAYFFIFTLGMLIYARKNIFQAMQFVRNIMKWVFFKDNRARVQVLRTQLQ